MEIKFPLACCLSLDVAVPVSHTLILLGIFLVTVTSDLQQPAANSIVSRILDVLHGPLLSGTNIPFLAFSVFLGPTHYLSPLSK